MVVEVLETLPETHVEDLLALYRETWWSTDRQPEDVRRMLEATDEVVAVRADGNLVAFARVLTDYTYKALVFDVIVAESHRGRGLGRRLLEELCSRPALADVEHVELYCEPDLADFYEQFDFADLSAELRLMRREHA